MLAAGCKREARAALRRFGRMGADSPVFETVCPRLDPECSAVQAAA